MADKHLDRPAALPQGSTALARGQTGPIKPAGSSSPTALATQAAPAPAPGPAATASPEGLLTKRPRGRPKGSKTRVLRHSGALGVHHFAFLRSWFLRLDMREAWQRYLAFSELSSDLRHIEHRRSELLNQVLDAGHQLNLSLAPNLQVTAQLAALAQPPFDTASAPLPPLDDFVDAQGLDREFYSEAELLQEYRDFYHLDSVPENGSDEANPAAAAAAGTAAAEAARWTATGSAGGPMQVRALNQIEALLAREPQADDRLDLWLSPALAAMLKHAGVATLGALADTVRVYGRNWYTRASRLGATRAGHLVDWLAPLAERFGHPIPAEAREPLQRQRALRSASLRLVEMGPRFAIVPLNQLAVPAPLAGGRAAPGRFATGMANHLGATDDLSAIRHWLKAYEGSPATHRAYAKEVERFYLWCLHARGKPLSSVDSMDGLAYKQFLGAVPPDWVNPRPAPRTDPAWRPFRGALSASSVKYALVVVQTLFDGLCAANYLVGNPLRSVGKQVRLPARRLPLERSFTENEWAFVLGQLALQTALTGTPDKPERGQAEAHRIRLLLEMLASTGLRLAEIAGASMASLSQVAVDGEPEPATVIEVLGKGNKLREVPVGEDILALIRQHHADAVRVVGRGAALPSPAPIVCTLGEAPRRWVDGADGKVALSALGAPAVRALGPMGIYLTLKRFFRRISANASAVDGLSKERLMAASTHWLRHTFGRQGAAAGVPVEVLRQAFGHASLATTSLYLNTERSRMITALHKARSARKLASPTD